MLSTDVMDALCWRKAGPDICAARSKLGKCCRDRRPPKSNQTPYLADVLARWKPVVAKTSTALGGFVNLAELVAREFGPVVLDRILAATWAAGESDFCEGLRQRLGQYRQSRQPRGPQHFRKAVPQ